MTRVLQDRAPGVLWLLLLLALPVLLLACAPDRGEARVQAQAEEAQAEEEGRLRLELDQSARELYVYIDGERVATHQVAVGQPEHPTPTGEFSIHQVDWNPDWTPPPGEEWTEDREPKDPGDPDNPMGRARLSYQGAYSIHGTDVLESLGTAASHGSIRVANEDVTELARLVMEHGGAARSESWYEEARANRTEMREVSIPNPVQFVIYE